MTMRRMAMAKSHLRISVSRFPTSCLAKGGDSRSRKGGWGLGVSITACDASESRNARLKRCASACKREWLSGGHLRSKARSAPTLRVLDRAIQAHGGAGVSQDTFLAAAWANVRTLRLADGPDEVHMESIAKHELGKWAKTQKQSAAK